MTRPAWDRDGWKQRYAEPLQVWERLAGNRREVVVGRKFEPWWWAVYQGPEAKRIADGFAVRLHLGMKLAELTTGQEEERA